MIKVSSITALLYVPDFEILLNFTYQIIKEPLFQDITIFLSSTHVNNIVHVDISSIDDSYPYEENVYQTYQVAHFPANASISEKHSYSSTEVMQRSPEVVAKIQSICPDYYALLAGTLEEKGYLLNSREEHDNASVHYWKFVEGKYEAPELNYPHNISHNLFYKLHDRFLHVRGVQGNRPAQLEDLATLFVTLKYAIKNGEPLIEALNNIPLSADAAEIAKVKELFRAKENQYTLDRKALSTLPESQLKGQFCQYLGYLAQSGLNLSSQAASADPKKRSHQEIMTAFINKENELFPSAILYSGIPLEKKN